MMTNKYSLFTVVTWPESQALIDLPGFREHCHLINDSEGLSQFGPQAYMCEISWLNEH